ncbi:MAG: hypothetical protein H6581_03155 [Bacteroidia bacterium]|nr:hypothetical protein [Bacteroidia bacterium]
MKLSNITLALALLFTLFFSACSPIQDDPLAEQNNQPQQTDEAFLQTIDTDGAAYKGGSTVCDVYTLPMVTTASSQYQSFGNVVFSHTVTDLTIDVKPSPGLKLTNVEIWEGDFNASLPLLPSGTPDVSQFPRQYTYPTGVTLHQEIISKSQLFPCHGFAIHAGVAFFGPNGNILLAKDAWMFGHKQGGGMVIELCIPVCGEITSSLGI